MFYFMNYVTSKQRTMEENSLTFTCLVTATDEFSVDHIGSVNFNHASRGSGFTVNIVSDGQSPQRECTPTKIDWDKMMRNAEFIPKTIVDFTFDPDRLTFDFSVQLEYIGASTSRTSFVEFGTNYIIDFVSFKTTDSVDKPNSCSNRITSSYTNRDWNEWWEYSTTPWKDEHIGSDKYLSYPPPSKYWTIAYIDTTDDDTCGFVSYHGHFTLSELMNCSGIKIEEDGTHYRILGKLYVNILSPIAQNLRHLYKIYNINGKAFQIQVQKTVDVISLLQK
eukprot:960032_1